MLNRRRGEALCTSRSGFTLGPTESVRRVWLKLCKSGRKALINTPVSDRYADARGRFSVGEGWFEVKGEVRRFCKMAVQLPGSSPDSTAATLPSSNPRRGLHPPLSKSPPRIRPGRRRSFSHPALDEALPTPHRVRHPRLLGSGRPTL